MSAFNKLRQVKATRKPHCCDSCERPISVGSPAVYWAGDCEGEFYSFYQHVDCRAAERAWNEWADFAWDEWCHLWHFFDELDDVGFCDRSLIEFLPELEAHWPEVLRRLDERAIARGRPRVAQSNTLGQPSA